MFVAVVIRENETCRYTSHSMGLQQAMKTTEQKK